MSKLSKDGKKPIIIVKPIKPHCPISPNSREYMIQAFDVIWKFYEADKQSLIDFFRSGYKHFDKKAKEKEAEEMEKQLNRMRQACKQIKQLIEAQEPSEKELEETGVKLFEKHGMFPTMKMLEIFKEYDKLRRGYDGKKR